MKLNLGCGFDRRDGFVNIDNRLVCKPDAVADLEEFPWPFRNDFATEIVLSHVLEHLGESREVYLKVIQELYRISAPGALVNITVPHPRHDNFLMDPTHIRPISADQFFMFSKKKIFEWREEGAANTPLAEILNVDFDVMEVKSLPDDKWLTQLRAGKISSEELAHLAQHQFNIIKEITIELRAVK